MPACTLINLIGFFGDYARHEGIQPEQLAHDIRDIIWGSKDDADTEYFSESQIHEARMQKLDALIGGHGIEPIRGDDYHVDSYHGDIVATYVNTGDTYSATILYETENERFVVTTFDDWVEANQKKYNIR